MSTQVKPTSKFVTANGLRIHYLDWGNDGAMPLIMLHGLRSYGRAWDPVAREFADRYHIVALDQRGRGDSGWSPEAAYYTDDYVSDLEEMVQQLGLKRFVLMGHSMGGANSIVYASRHPDQVAAAVIEDMGPRPLSTAPNSGGARIAQELENTPMEFSTWDIARAFWRKERPLISEEALTIRLENTLKELPGGAIGWKYDIQGIVRAGLNRDTANQIDLWPHTRDLKCPTLVLRGEISDILSQETCSEMAEANLNIKCVEVPGASHYVHDDNLEFYNREVRIFLENIK